MLCVVLVCLGFFLGVKDRQKNKEKYVPPGLRGRRLKVGGVGRGECTCTLGIFIAEERAH